MLCDVMTIIVTCSWVGLRQVVSIPLSLPLPLSRFLLSPSLSSLIVFPLVRIFGARELHKRDVSVLKACACVLGSRNWPISWGTEKKMSIGRVARRREPLEA